MKMKNTVIALGSLVTLAFVSCDKKASSGGTPNGVPLTTQLPPELIEGTPKPYSSDNLEAVAVSAPQFSVPQGTVLLSKGKPVTSSDTSPIIGSLELVTDGDKDAADGFFVELADGPQWLQIDLQKSAEIYGVWLWHFHSQKRVYNDVIVQISDDAEFKTGVTTVFNNDADNSSAMGKGSDKSYVETRFGKLVDGKGTKGRYVRMYSKGCSATDLNHYIEVEVFGKEAQ